MPRPALRLALALAAALAFATGAASVAHARPGPDRLARLQADVADVLARYRAPGVGLALVDRAGVVWAGGVGVADVASGRPVAADTLFRVGSITKSFVALAAAHLHERGTLDLDAPLAALLPDVAMANPWADESPVTLAHVLEHTAGFDDMRFSELVYGDGDTPLLDVLARNPRSRTSRWRPGTRFSYANPGYTVAAAAIERATGRGYREVLLDDVFGPLGMTDVHWPALAPGVRERLASGYERPGETAEPWALAHHPAGALVTSPVELATFVHRWLTDSDAVASPAMRERVQRGATLPYGPLDTDYGLGNYGTTFLGARCRGHDGGLPGFVSTYRYCPDLGIGFVVLSNQTFARRAHAAIERLLFSALTEATALPPAPRAPESAAERARVAGYYQFASPRHQLIGFLETLHGIEIVDSAEGLVARPTFGGEVRLVRAGDGTYRLPFEGGTSVRFARDASGRDVLLANGGHFVRAAQRPARLRRAAAIAGWHGLRAASWAGALLLLAWLTAALTGRPARPDALRAVALPALSATSLFATLLVLQVAGVFALATRSPAAIAICALTMAHAGFAAAACVDGVTRLWGGRHLGARARATRALAFGAAVVCAGYAVWLGSNGIIGIRTWLW